MQLGDVGPVLVFRTLPEAQYQTEAPTKIASDTLAWLQDSDGGA